MSKTERLNVLFEKWKTAHTEESEDNTKKTISGNIVYNFTNICYNVVAIKGACKYTSYQNYGGIIYGYQEH